MKQENISQLLDTIGDLVERLPLEEMERSSTADGGSDRAGLGGAIDIKAYVRLLWQWLWLMILCAILFGASAYYLAITATPIYQATSTWRVDEGSNPTPTFTDIRLGAFTAQTYAQMMAYAPVKEAVAARLNLDPAVFNKDVTSISVTPVRDTQLLNVRIQGVSPSLIALTANTLPDVFREQIAAEQSERFAASKTSLQAQMNAIEQNIERIQDGIEGLDNPINAAEELEMARLQNSLSLYQNQFGNLLNSFEQIRVEESRSLTTLTIANPARLPNNPIRPRVLVNTLMAAVVGVLLALGFVFLLDFLDDRIKTPREVRRLFNAPFLGAAADISTGQRRWEPQDALISLHAPRNPITEAYRGIRTNLQFANVDQQVRSIMVTSALPSEGKTTTAANLAVVMAQSGLKVALVDADLRKPSVHKIFQVPQRPGLVDGLMQENGYILSSSGERNIRNLYITPSGQRPPNPAELLGSERMSKFLISLQEQVDIVIFDAPPVVAVADAQILSTIVDGVVCVVRRGTPRQAISRTAESLGQVNANLLGFVMNRMVKADGEDYYYYYNYYYDEVHANGGTDTSDQTPRPKHYPNGYGEGQNGSGPTSWVNSVRDGHAKNGKVQSQYELYNQQTTTIRAVGSRRGS
ncbi:MAG: polysaccharide biosynthesis tyrosine autokinase [Chloroflexota bacterium]